jgi:hypothetical protein
LARRASPVALAKLTPEERATVEANLTQPTSMPVFKLPHELELRGVELGATIVVPRPSLHDPASQYLVADPRMHELEPITKYESMRPIYFRQFQLPMQEEAARRWYSLHQTVDYMRLFHAEQIRQGVKQIGRVSSDSLPVLFPTNDADGVTASFSLNGCTAADFESYIARRILLNPEMTCEWLSRATRVLNGDESHPTKQMWLKRARTVTSTDSK